MVLPAWHLHAVIWPFVQSPYSYVVDMGDGSRRHLHANRIRKFIVRSHLVGVLKEDDDDFGEVPF